MAHNNKGNGNRYPGGTASGHPKRHFLTTGWSDFVNAKKLVPGDAIRGENGELCVGVRRRMNHTPSVTSSRQNAILATASNAITSGTRFLVTYTPRASQSPFIISLNKYLEAQSHRFSVGMKFEMKFEGEEVLEQRFSGTIVGVGETASSKWPDSEWRSLKGGKWRALCWVRRRMIQTPSSRNQYAILATASHAITSGTWFLVTYRPRGGNEELCVGVRRRMNHTPSSQNQCAILATASHAITSGTRFLVAYRPRKVLRSSSCCDIKLFV